MIGNPRTSKPNTDARQFYLEEVQQEIFDHDKYHRIRMRAYRLSRMVVIVAAGLVPIFAAVDGIPKWVLGILGGLAAASEAVQQLYQMRQSALQAMRTGNLLAREMRMYLTASGPYSTASDSDAFELLTRRVENIRQSAEILFADTWLQEDREMKSPEITEGRPEPSSDMSPTS